MITLAIIYLFLMQVAQPLPVLYAIKNCRYFKKL